MPVELCDPEGTPTTNELPPDPTTDKPPTPAPVEGVKEGEPEPQETAKEKRTRRRSEAKKLKDMQKQLEREKREKEELAKYEGTPILDNLYVGGRLAAQNYDWIIEKLGDNAHILNVTSELKNYHSSLTYLKIPVADSMDVDISKHFEGAASFIDGAFAKGAAVLVHCREGKSRSLTMIIAYLMMRKGWTLERAYKHVLEVLPYKENINQGFKVQLMNLDLKREGKEELSMQFYDKRSRRKSASYCDVAVVKQREEGEEGEEGEEVEMEEEGEGDSSDGSFDVSKERKVRKPRKSKKKVNTAKLPAAKSPLMESFESYWKKLIGEQREGKVLKEQENQQQPQPQPQQDTVVESVVKDQGEDTATKKRKRSKSLDQSKPRKKAKDESKAKTKTKSKSKATASGDSEKENKAKEKKKSEIQRTRTPTKTPTKTPTQKAKKEDFHTKDIMSYFLPASKIQQ
eukprot:TRINITY_DN1873_c1_g1_i3.p2 TRINITY_DN1873_c1_g1~~TRINITY_DN1873_c1_g1_i3.p2  ORF type:complete len:507 (+),score=160.08 TRINITY_DN1873_c1_g1_i3:149-1522(+)